MDNPYQAPEPNALTRDTFRAQWQRPLHCPHCDRTTIKAWQAWLRYPRRKIRCEACRHQSRITLDGAMWWKYWAIWLVPVVVGLLNRWLLKTFEADEAFLNRIAQFELSVDRTPASRLLLGILVLLVMCVATAPIVVSFLWVSRITLRMVANHAFLTSVAGTSCSHDTRAE